MSKHKILVVNSDAEVRKSLDEYFTENGYEIEVFPDSTGIYERVKSEAPDIMLLEFDGTEPQETADLIRLIRPTDKDTPIIFLTNKIKRGDAWVDLEMGADEYVTRPYDLEELKLRAKNAIASSKKRDNDE